MQAGIAWGVVYVIAAVASRATRPDDVPVGLLWLAAGVAVLWLWSVRGWRRWSTSIALLVVAGLVNLITGAPPFASAMFALANVTHAVVATALLDRWARRDAPVDLTGTRDVFRLAGAMIAGALASVPFGVAVWARESSDGLWLAGVAWVLRYAIDSALVVAVFLSWRHRRSSATPPLDWPEAVAMTVAVVALYGVVFSASAGQPTAFVVLPLTVWVGMRAGPFPSTLHGMFAAGVSSVATVLHRGPFADMDDPVEQNMLVQAYIASIGVVVLVLSMAVEERRRASAAMAETQEELQRTLDSTPIGHAVVDLPTGTITYANPSLHAWARAAEQLVGRSWLEFVSDDDRPVAKTGLAQVAHGRGRWTGELCFDVAGAFRWCEVSLAPLSVGSSVDGARRASLQLLDVTARRELADRLGHQAMHDSLTGLPNRALLQDRLDHALAAGRRSGSELALVFLDIDHFKTINDSLGHQAGDTVIVTLGRRLSGVVRPGDTVARVGGDEFVVCCPDIDGRQHAGDIAARLLHAAGRPIEIDGRTVTISVSAGIAIADGRVEAADLMREADTAMYQAKGRGRGRVEFFEQRLYERARQQLQMTADVRTALASEQLRLYYQPMVRLDSGAVVAVEALLRWEHPEQGILPPGTWLSTIEQTDLMPHVGDWVLDHALRQAVALPADRSVRMHVNISASQFRDSGLLEAVSHTLERTGLAPERLVLELTESQLLAATTQVLSELHTLSGMGVTLSMDDFGTHYSSLTQLVTLPVHEVKIDKSFVLAMDTNPRARAIVHGILGMASAIGLDVVAEGVEHEHIADELREAGCPIGQGFLWSPARPWQELVGTF